MQTRAGDKNVWHCVRSQSSLQAGLWCRLRLHGCCSSHANLVLTSCSNVTDPWKRLVATLLNHLQVAHLRAHIHRDQRYFAAKGSQLECCILQPWHARVRIKRSDSPWYQPQFIAVWRVPASSLARRRYFSGKALPVSGTAGRGCVSLQARVHRSSTLPSIIARHNLRSCAGLLATARTPHTPRRGGQMSHAWPVCWAAVKRLHVIDRQLACVELFVGCRKQSLYHVLKLLKSALGSSRHQYPDRNTMRCAVGLGISITWMPETVR